MTRVHSECLVWGALALTLQVSRFAGVSPLRMIKDEGKWRVSVSTAVCIYSYLVLFGLHAGVLTGLAIDLGLEHAEAVRVRTPTECIAWIAELIVILTISTIGVLGSPSRMNKMIEYLNIIEKVNIKSNNERASKCAERKRYIAAVVCLFAVNLHIFSHLYYYINEAINVGRDLQVACIYSLFYMEFQMTVLLEMQFIFLALQVNSYLKSVNDSLNDLKYIIDLQNMPSLFTLLPNEADNNRVILATPASIRIDGQKCGEKPKRKGASTIKMAEERIRWHLVAFGAICDVMTQINVSFGNILLLLIVSFFLHLVLAPYYLVSYLLNPKDDVVSLLFHVLYCVLHTSYLLIAVEPGHRTEREMERTSMLVSQLLRRVSSPDDGLASELDLFYRHIALHQVSYCPLGMCTLGRPLITAICGGVTTYLVIILQFQALDKQNS